MSKLQKLTEDFAKMKEEFEKLKKAKDKSDKHSDLKAKEMDGELKECYNEVNRLTQENEKLLEENKTLEELRKVNEMLQKENSNKRIEKSDAEDADAEESEDEYSADEEVAAFFAEQAKNRKSRTSPQTEAEASNYKEKDVPKKFSCTKCNFRTTNESILNEHVRSNHSSPNPFVCDQCQFTTTTAVNLAWHKEAMHTTQNNQQNNHQPSISKKVQKMCNFWFNGFCRYSDIECRFLHKNPPRCKFQMDCMAWPNCNFYHDENYSRGACHYQEKCRRQNCMFEHFNVNSEHFLGGGQLPPEMNIHNFPHLNQNQGYNQNQWGNGQQNNHWRPW